MTETEKATIVSGLIYRRAMTPAEMADPAKQNVRGTYDKSLRRTAACVYRGCPAPATAFAVHPISGEVRRVGDGSCEHCWRSHSLRGHLRNGRHGGRQPSGGNELIEQPKVRKALAVDGWQVQPGTRDSAGEPDHIITGHDVRIVAEQKDGTFTTRDYGQLDGYVMVEKPGTKGLAIAPNFHPVAVRQLERAGYFYVTLSEIKGGWCLDLAPQSLVGGAAAYLIQGGGLPSHRSVPRFQYRLQFFLVVAPREAWFHYPQMGPKSTSPWETNVEIRMPKQAA